MTPRQLADAELVHAFGETAVKIIQWIKESDAAPSLKLSELSRIAEVADIFHGRLAAEIKNPRAAGQGTQKTPSL